MFGAGYLNSRCFYAIRRARCIIEIGIIFFVFLVGYAQYDTGFPTI